MADTFKCLAQSNPAATTLTDIYTVPGATSSVISSVVICNQAGSTGTYRLSIAIAGAANVTKQYLAYDATLNANDSVTLTLGLSLATTDVVRVYCSSANFSINVFGVEVT